MKWWRARRERRRHAEQVAEGTPGSEQEEPVLLDDQDSRWADDLHRMSPEQLRAWDEAGRPATLYQGGALMEELERHEALLAHYRRLQAGEDSRYPGGPIIRGLGNAKPGDIGYTESADTWSSLQALIEAEEAEIAAIKERMREAADYHEEREDT